jgi:hypothetical protein
MPGMRFANIYFGYKNYFFRGVVSMKKLVLILFIALAPILLVSCDNDKSSDSGSGDSSKQAQQGLSAADQLKNMQ